MNQPQFEQGRHHYQAPQYQAPQYVPPPPQYPSAAQYAPPPAPPEPPKKKRKWPWVVGGFVALIVLGSAVNGGNSRPAATTSAPSAPSAPAAQQAPAVAEAESDASSGPDFSQGIPEGTWGVPDQVAPGKYRSTGAKAGIFDVCMVSTSSEDGNVLDLDSGNAGEQVQITVTSKAAEFKNTGCEPFVKVG